MSRSPTRVLPRDDREPLQRDGVSQQRRPLPALDPGSVRLDDRTTRDLLRFTRELADNVTLATADPALEQLRSEGTWLPFVQRDDVSIDDIVAYIEDPARFTGERARWLGRPHFALLLTFLELMRHARDQLNGIVGRHLDHYYRDVLGMALERSVADRAAVVFTAAAGADAVRIPAGTELQAGRDAAGRPRFYRTERELLVNQSQVAALRSVYVDRERVGLADVRKDESLTVAEVLDYMLRLAVGRPKAGDQIEDFEKNKVNTTFLASLLPFLDFARDALSLEHHELRSLVRLHARRGEAATPEWQRINALLGVVNPPDPRDFDANLASRIGEVDFKLDGWPEIESFDDLFVMRDGSKTDTEGTVTTVRSLIEKIFAPFGAAGFDTFVELMSLKRRIDAEWREINRLLDVAGRRRRKSFTWTLQSLDDYDPTAFDANLLATLEGKPQWPAGISDLFAYAARVRRLERHLSMPAERLRAIAAFAAKHGSNPQAATLEWKPIERALADAHVEQSRAGRRLRLEVARGTNDNREGLIAVVNAALHTEARPLAWSEARARLAAVLEPAQARLLDQFHTDLGEELRTAAFGWEDAYRLIDLATRALEGFTDPIAERLWLRNVYAHDDATQVLVDAQRSKRWCTFARRPPRSAPTPGATIGFALRSPALELHEGKRTLTLTVGFDDELGVFGRGPFLEGLGLDLSATPNPTAPEILAALEHALLVEASTEKGFLALEITDAKLVTGGDGGNYYDLIAVAADGRRRWPALQLTVVAGTAVPALTSAPGDDGFPMVRICCKQIPPVGPGQRWSTHLQAFEGLVVGALHLRVDVVGLKTLALQQADRVVDPKKPFEPFGPRPAVGSRFYVWHPELTQLPLTSLTFDVTWMGLPTNLSDKYFNYPTRSVEPPPFKSKFMVVDDNTEHDLGEQLLFVHDNGDHTTAATKALTVDVARLALPRRTAAEAPRDIRAASRHLVWELGTPDFGHGDYPTIAAHQARLLAIKLAGGGAGADAALYRVEAPYTPTIKAITAAYVRSIEVRPSKSEAGDEFVHIAAFGSQPVEAGAPSLFPRYHDAGELHIGLVGANAPQHLSLWFQVAAGSSDPDVAGSRLQWSYARSDGWVPLPADAVHFDSTRGLLASGNVELALPATSRPAEQPDRYWLKLAVPRDARSVCDMIGIHTQAVLARFDDRENAAEHYLAPLPAETVTRLLEPDARIVGVLQPYASFGGKPSEVAARFHTRVSERLRHKQRALSPWDFERLTLQRFPQLYKAKCLRAGTALPRSQGTDDRSVTVIVVPDVRQSLPGEMFGPKASAELLAEIQAYLAERATPNAIVQVRNASYLGVRARLGVRFRAGEDEVAAKRRLNQDIVRFFSPWAFDDSAEVTIGGRFYANSLIDFVDRRDYVDFVAEVTLFRSPSEGADPVIVPPGAVDYHVGTEAPDQVLVSWAEHTIDVIPETGYQQSSFIGINYMRVELDFIVG